MSKTKEYIDYLNSVLNIIFQRCGNISGKFDDICQTEGGHYANTLLGKGNLRSTTSQLDIIQYFIFWYVQP